MNLSINEIRIGNIISKNDKTILVTLDNISEVLHHIEEYKPIYINKEILLKSGFKPLERNNCYAIDKSEDYYLIFTGKIGILYKIGTGTVSIPVRYLHELQNTLYYIEGKEITIVL